MPIKICAWIVLGAASRPENPFGCPSEYLENPSLYLESKLADLATFFEGYEEEKVVLLHNPWGVAFAQPVGASDNEYAYDMPLAPLLEAKGVYPNIAQSLCVGIRKLETAGYTVRLYTGNTRPSDGTFDSYYGPILEKVSSVLGSLRSLPNRNELAIDATGDAQTNDDRFWILQAVAACGHPVATEPTFGATRGPQLLTFVPRAYQTTQGALLPDQSWHIPFDDPSIYGKVSFLQNETYTDEVLTSLLGICNSYNFEFFSGLGGRTAVELEQLAQVPPTVVSAEFVFPTVILTFSEPMVQSAQSASDYFIRILDEIVTIHDITWDSATQLAFTVGAPTSPDLQSPIIKTTVSYDETELVSLSTGLSVEPFEIPIVES